MASTYSDLKIELIGTGDQTGAWGTTTNNNFSVAISEAITGSADVAFTSADQTVTLTNSNTAQTARNLRLNLTGTSGGARQLILGSGCQIEKLYLINNGLADAVTVINTSYSGVAVSTITFVTTTATATTSSNHGLTTNQTIVMTGCTPAAYNGTFVVTVTGLTTFTYTMLSTPASNATVVGSYTTPGTGVIVPAGKSMFVYNTATNVVEVTTSLNLPTITGYTETVVAIPVPVGASHTFVITTGTVQTATLTASTPCTFTMPTATAGTSFILKLTQAASGMTTATFTGVKFPGGTAPTITATASAVDIISFIADGTSWFGSAIQNLS